MKKKSIIAIIVVFLFTITIFIFTDQNINETPSQKISAAVQAILNGSDMEHLFTDTQFDKITEFREKLMQEDLSNYNIQAFQPENVEIVYLMLISRPPSKEQEGLVLYMTFDIKDEEQLKIENIIISNWVKIEYAAKQF